MNKENNEVVEDVLKEKQEPLEVLEKMEVVDIDEKPEIKVLELKVKRHVEAQLLIEEAENIVSVCDAKSDACKLLLENDLREYEKAERSLRENALEECKLLLEKLGYSNFVSQRNEDEKILNFEAHEPSRNFEIQRLKKGRFSGFLYAFLASLIFAISLLYLATEKLGIALDISRIPSAETIANIFNWFASLVGMDKDISVGIGFFIFLVLAMMLVIYVIRIHFKDKKNLILAESQLEEAEGYKESQGQCQWEMEKVEVHMKETLDTLGLYEVILKEQRMKFERILYIEGVDHKEGDYHVKSLREMMDTKKLIEMIEDFMSIAISEEGKLSEKSVIYLAQAKIEMNKVLVRFYG